MINLKFLFPFFLLFLHHHLSNSIFGLNNPNVSIFVFFSFIFSLFFFLSQNKKVGRTKFVFTSVTIFFILLWAVNSSVFKDFSFFVLNLFLGYYIYCQKGFQYIKSQLAFLVISSSIISIIQISGISTFVHLFNSQFLYESSLGLVQYIELTNLFSTGVDPYFEFDSRQVRPSGIFHSSALLSGIFVLYIAYIFLGFFSSVKFYFFIPFLCIFSGSKLVLLTTLLFFLLCILFQRISFKQIFAIFIGSVFSILIHRILFKHLMDFQFNYDILLYSFDIRFFQYSMDNLDSAYVSYLFYVSFIIGISFLFINYFFKIIPPSFNFLIVFIAFMASFFATPHIANLFFGWFYFPSFFLRRED